MAAEETILTGGKLNILGRNLIKIQSEYNVSIFENFNIFVLSKDKDLSSKIEYRNCCIHFVSLNPISEYSWKFNASDTLTLNFINLSNTNHADVILNTILSFHHKKDEFSFTNYRILADFIDFNILNRQINDEYGHSMTYGSELFAPTRITVNNINDKKLKFDLYAFSNNYISTGAKIITKINDVTVYISKGKDVKLLNDDIKIMKQ